MKVFSLWPPFTVSLKRPPAPPEKKKEKQTNKHIDVSWIRWSRIEVALSLAHPKNRAELRTVLPWFAGKAAKASKALVV